MSDQLHVELRARARGGRGVVVWSFSFWAATPFREAYVNALIPSAQLATVLSFDNLMDSAGGALAQPMLGRVADASGYPASYRVCSAIQAAALPFVAARPPAGRAVRRDRAQARPALM